MRLGSQPTVEAPLALRGEGKARDCLIPIQVVGLHPVKALGAAQIETRLKDRSEHLQLADVEPPLAGPACIRSPDQLARERLRIRPPLLEAAGAPLTNGAPSAGVEVRDDFPLCLPP